MPVDSTYLIARDGLKLYYRYWLPDKIKKVLCIVHGHGEHSGRYQRLASHLMEKGIGTYCLDLRGHGKSAGKRGHAASMDILLNDIEELMKAARVQHLHEQIFLFGHSMGGNLVANYMISKDSKEVSGFVLSSPWFQLKFTPPEWKIRSGLFIGKFWPSFQSRSGLDPNKLSRIRSEVEKYIEDPMIHDKISASLFKIILDGSKTALEKVSEIKKPGLIYHGTSDEIISWKATEQFATSKDKFVWKKINGGYHESHNDEGREDVLQMLGTWISQTKP